MITSRRAVRTTMIAAVAALGLVGGFAAGAPPVQRAHASVTPVPAIHGHYLKFAASRPPTTADCLAQLKIRCYSPLQYQQAYDLKPLYNRGITGRGRTIVLVDAFGSPTITHDLQTFDRTYGLPNPRLSIIQPSGPVPPYDKSDTTRQSWAFETTLDVEYAHAMAPGANIMLVETPVAETEGVTGLPEMMDAEQYVVRHRLGDVISQSFGATEETFPSNKDIYRLRYAFLAAQQAGVTVLASSGDDGSTNAELNGSDLYPYRVNSWPSSDPLVTSVGGTMLTLNARGNRIAPDRVWNDGYGAGGGGLSAAFTRPNFQDSVRGVVGSRRGTPDVSLSAAVNGGALVYLSFPGLTAGYYIVGGTSEASPLLAGVVALTDQLAGHRIGNINAALYQLGRQSTARGGVVDVTRGNNAFAGVPGYRATAGYDLASGVGTIDGAQFVPALARLAG